MKNVLILSVLLFSLNGFTQITTLKDKDAVSDFNLKTMELFKNGEVEQAFQAFYTYWAFADTDFRC